MGFRYPETIDALGVRMLYGSHDLDLALTTSANDTIIIPTESPSGGTVEGSSGGAQHGPDRNDIRLGCARVSLAPGARFLLVLPAAAAEKTPEAARLIRRSRAGCGHEARTSRDSRPEACDFGKREGGCGGTGWEGDTTADSWLDTSVITAIIQLLWREVRGESVVNN